MSLRTFESFWRVDRVSLPPIFVPLSPICFSFQPKHSAALLCIVDIMKSGGISRTWKVCRCCLNVKGLMRRIRAQGLLIYAFVACDRL